MDDVLCRIAARLEGHDHADWCNEGSPCDCRPGAEPNELAAAIRDVLNVCDDFDQSEPLALFADSIRLTIASRLRIVDASEVNRLLTRRVLGGGS
jgi:hypothetical protein